jgi:cytidine deaminase
MKQQYTFTYEKFSDISQISAVYRRVLERARLSTQDAHAPYSNFNVGCAILYNDANIITGFNIENASYPVGICAERSALSALLTQHPKAKIEALAISYEGANIANNKPAFPCGMCRQFILECEVRNNKPIPLILSGLSGEVIIINSVKDILPFYFTADSMK